MEEEKRRFRDSQIPHRHLFKWTFLIRTVAGTSNQASICDSCSARMDQRHSKLGVKPKWNAHADWSDMSGDESSASTIPPWRKQSLWRITTTETVEGLSEQPKCGVKQQYEALLKKHAIEYTKLIKEYENMEAAGNEKNEEFEAKEKRWKKTIEEIFSLMKELTGRTSGQKVEKSAEEGQQEGSLSQRSDRD